MLDNFGKEHIRDSYILTTRNDIAKHIHRLTSTTNPEKARALNNQPLLEGISAMETDLEKNRQAIPELMRSRWSGIYSEKLIRSIELLMERMIACEEEAIPEDLRGIDGVPHLFRAARCLLEIAEEPPETATILAILGHDWDRCLVRVRVARDLFPGTASGYEAYKSSSSVVSALEFCNNVIPSELFEHASARILPPSTRRK